MPSCLHSNSDTVGAMHQPYVIPYMSSVRPTDGAVFLCGHMMLNQCVFLVFLPEICRVMDNLLFVCNDQLHLRHFFRLCESSGQCRS